MAMSVHCRTGHLARQNLEGAGNLRAVRVGRQLAWGRGTRAHPNIRDRARLQVPVAMLTGSRLGVEWIFEGQNSGRPDHRSLCSETGRGPVLGLLAAPHPDLRKALLA